MIRMVLRHASLHWLLGACCASLAIASFAVAQAPPAGDERRAVDRPPFDVVVLKQSAGGAKLEVLPLDLPQRPLATLPTQGALQVRLLSRPGEVYEVAWSDVAQVHVYEQILLHDAQRLVSAGDFDTAFDYYAQLLGQYPDLPGLAKAVDDYLRTNALALYQAKQHDRALAVLLTLHKRNPDYPGLAGAVQTVAQEVIQQYLRDGDYAAARGVLELWQQQFSGVATAAAADWQRRFEAAANRQVQQAEQLAQSNNYIAARKAVGRAIAIWPELESATRMLAQIQQQFPFVTVGVAERSPRDAAHRMDSWPALRASRLTERLISEQVDFGAEGGIYQCPFGEMEISESGRELDIRLTRSPRGLTADRLARHLLSLAQPESAYYRRDFAGLLQGVSLPAPNEVRLHFSRIHVRPEALLQIPPPAETVDLSAHQLTIAEYTSEQVVFTTSGAGEATGLRAVVEQTMTDDNAAVSALLAGEIDVLDRVPPWHLESLRNAANIRVGTYRLPTVHVLIPNLEKPLLAKREFRRALCYGVDRRWLLQKVLLGGRSEPGFEVVSGPFPAGLSLSDPLRYGYNNGLVPRSFEPRLAAILATVAWTAVQKPDEDASAGEEGEAQEDKPFEPAALEEMPTLSLAHSSDPVARLACQTIASQLQRAGLRIALHEVSAEELIANDADFDLRYAELAVWEPLTDARTILGPGGLAGDLKSPYLNAALRALDVATNWNDVRQALADLHDIAHHELPVIPLWQTANFFAYRTNIDGIDESPMTLYENIDNWTPRASRNVAQRTGTP